MVTGNLQSGCNSKRLSPIGRLYHFLAQRAYTNIVLAALFCTLAVKLFHSCRLNMVGEYFGWILSDIAVLVGIELVLAAACFRWRQRWVFRTVTIFAVVVCTWSVMNAGWIIRTGTQILPHVLLPLIRDPFNALFIIGVNLAEMPATAVILLGPSAVALTFFFSVLAKPPAASYVSGKHFANRTVLCLSIILFAMLANAVNTPQGSASIASAGLRYNCHLRVITSLFNGSSRRSKKSLVNIKRILPAFDQIEITRLSKSQPTNHNVVIVVLEGIQYRYTSLAGKKNDLTGYMASLAQQGVQFTSARSSLTHTTKALFGLLTGRFPSVAQDLAETVPAEKPYAGLATILKQKLNFRTAFFQSARGNFEARPGLVGNLGFDKFWAREDLDDPNAFVGYLACDEFSMLEPITNWIKADQKPFLLTVLCSVTHDPYEVPLWFAESDKEPVARYKQTISYTDEFIAALDAKLAELNLADETIFCVIGDHGEAFGEHGMQGHERIAFDEALRIPWLIRAPSLVRPATRITQAVSSVDLTPTLLALLDFDISTAGFDGSDVLGTVQANRKVYFSGWIQQGPAGFIKANHKFIYYPADKAVFAYDLENDPCELARVEPDEKQTQEIIDDIIAWRKNTFFLLEQQRTGKKTLFDRWLCRWTNRICSAQYIPEIKD